MAVFDAEKNNNLNLSPDSITIRRLLLQNGADIDYVYPNTVGWIGDLSYLSNLSDLSDLSDLSW